MLPVLSLLHERRIGKTAMSRKNERMKLRQNASSGYGPSPSCGDFTTLRFTDSLTPENTMPTGKLVLDYVYEHEASHPTKGSSAWPRQAFAARDVKISIGRSAAAAG